MATAEQYRARRKELKWNQARTAFVAGVHPASVSNLERGHRVSPATARKLAAALDLDGAERRP